ncbi:MAG: peptidylprolyl isomerase [Bacteroidetes bacterium]|nr:peptidylprolyl isomerase [Bacteroidota bacterium]
MHHAWAPDAYSTGLKHMDGAIPMARSEPNTAMSNYFICLNDQPELDHGGRRNPNRMGFAAFCQVTHGMEIIHAIPSGMDSSQMLIEPVIVYAIERLP